MCGYKLELILMMYSVGIIRNVVNSMGHPQPCPPLCKLVGMMISVYVFNSLEAELLKSGQIPQWGWQFWHTVIGNVQYHQSPQVPNITCTHGHIYWDTRSEMPSLFEVCSAGIEYRVRDRGCGYIIAVYLVVLLVGCSWRQTLPVDAICTQCPVYVCVWYIQAYSTRMKY